MIHRLAASRSFRPLISRSDAQIARYFSPATFASLTSSPQFPIFTALNDTSTHRHYYHSSIRNFSSSHDDFSPQRKHNLEGNDSESEIFKLIESHVKENRIMLYMKGSPRQPMCGFSATVIQILKSSGVDFASVNVLDYPEVREGVKKYSQWPTIPQLYVDGEFVGGCDIIKDLHESGELKDMLKSPEKEGEE